ncbi:MAG: extracellular solute-binding protein [Deltaproteobacteria bacterium]|nr:MAG: extracellular solute-binding protein [Deltaproteobacteria bacterium]
MDTRTVAVDKQARATRLRAMSAAIRVCALLLALAAGCKESSSPPPPPAEVQLATDLSPAVIDTVLKAIERSGGPRAEEVAGMRAGVSALPGAAGAPVGGGRPEPVVARGDVRWDSEPYGAIAAAAKGELMPIPATGQDVPPLWKDPAGTWVAVGGRAVVMLVAVDELGEHGAPVRFTALTEKWLKDRVAIAVPTGGPSLAHFAALYQAWGAERMEAWLAGLKANGVQIFPDDDQVRQEVVAGRATVGILSSDEAAKAAASAAHVLVVYPNQRSIGTFVWPTALSVPKNARNREAAQRLASALADRSTEQLLVARLPGYLPLRPDIPVPPGVRSAANLVVVSVDPARIVEEIGRRKASLAAWARSLPKPSAGAAQLQKK